VGVIRGRGVAGEHRGDGTRSFWCLIGAGKRRHGGTVVDRGWQQWQMEKEDRGRSLVRLLTSVGVRRGVADPRAARAAVMGQRRRVVQWWAAREKEREEESR
jgi:hypothetical protein